MNSGPRIGVLGIGNILMGDDGIGPFVVKILEACYEFPPNVVLHDLGTPGLGITSFFADYDIIILVDAVSAKARPGSIRLYRKDQILRTPISQRISPHDPALVEALLFAEFSGKCPDQVLLVGIVPESTELGCTLTDDVRSAVLPAMSAVLAELHRLHAEPVARTQLEVPSIWWQEQEATVPKSAAGEAPHVPGYSR
jgi:hydrogenase maturation protease